MFNIRLSLSIVFLLLCTFCLGEFYETPCAAKLEEKYCKSVQSCSYREEDSKSVLISIDGTGSRNWLASRVNENQWRSTIGVANNTEWIWKSNVANFFEDYQGESHYWHGPDASELIKAGNQVEEIAGYGMRVICDFVGRRLAQLKVDPSSATADRLKQLALDGELAIDIIGFSRGGFTAMEISRKLQMNGCQVGGQQVRPLFVRFMGLYDPVQRDIDAGDLFTDQYDNEKIADTVLSVSIAERSSVLKSRTYFGYGVQGFDSPSWPRKRWQKRFEATHGGVGGYPGEGDCMDRSKIQWPFSLQHLQALLCADSYSEAAEKLEAPSVDIWMRHNAIVSGVPIPATDKAYYGNYRLFDL